MVKMKNHHNYLLLPLPLSLLRKSVGKQALM